jgi:hypothetical protein
MLALFAELAIFGMILFPQKRGVSALPSVSPPLSSFWSARCLGSEARNLPQESAAFRKKLAGEISGGMRLSIYKDGIRMFGHRPVLGAWNFSRRLPSIQELLHKFLCETKPTTIYVQLLAEMGILRFGTMGGS